MYRSSSPNTLGGSPCVAAYAGVGVGSVDDRLHATHARGLRRADGHHHVGELVAA
jgi:hypothetical protein